MSIYVCVFACVSRCVHVRCDCAPFVRLFVRSMPARAHIHACVDAAVVRCFAGRSCIVITSGPRHLDRSSCSCITAVRHCSAQHVTVAHVIVRVTCRFLHSACNGVAVSCTTDQVYADSAFSAGMRILKSKEDARPVEARYQDIVVEFQKVYRRTWSQPETRAVLSQVQVRGGCGGRRGL
jgi:hypothetical protein